MSELKQIEFNWIKSYILNYKMKKKCIIYIKWKYEIISYNMNFKLKYHEYFSYDNFSYDQIIMFFWKLAEINIFS